MHHLPSKPLLLLFILSLVSYLGVFLILSPHITHAAGNTYYVATNGSDSNPGTQSSPFGTIAKGLSVMGAGDTLYIRGGTYNEVIDTNYNKIPSGTSWTDAPLISAYAGETVIISGNGSFNLAVSSLNPIIQYLIFSNLVFDGSNDTSPNDDGIELWGGANHIRFQDIEIRFSQLSGVGVRPGNGNSSDFNEFIRVNIHDVGRSGRGHGFYIQTADNLIDGCSVHNIAGWGLHFYDGPVHRNTVRGNIVWNVGRRTDVNPVYASAAGVLIGSGDNNIAYNNVIYSNPNGLEIGYNGPTNNKAYNNTIYNNAGSGIQVRGDSNGAIVKNNIVYQNGADVSDLGSNTILAINLTTDPQFVNASAADFHLLSSSPAKDAGVSLPEVPCDFDGNGRPAGSSADIGAYEQGGTPGAGCSKGTIGTPTPAPTPRPPTVTITAIPSTLSVAGQGTTLQWSTTNATSCTASGGWSGPQALGGVARFTPTATTIYTLTCQGPGGTGTGSATVTVGASSSCTLYTSGSAIPQGFGVPWDVQNPSIMLLSAACTPPTVLLKVGNQYTSNVVYVYKTAYTAPSGAQGWTPVDLFGSQLISGSWYKSFAQGIAQMDTATPNYYVAYTCMWTGIKWMCGCRDSACSQSYWQIQKIQQ